MKYFVNTMVAYVLILGLWCVASMGLADDDVWVRKADMLIPREGASASVVDGKIYVIGGAEIEGEAVATVEEYNPATDVWTQKADMATARFGLATAAVNGKIYAIGGTTTDWNQTLALVEEYDPAMDTWTKKTNMPTPRYWISASVLDGKIYVIGGWASNGISSALEEYDPATDIWSRKASMPTARSTSVGLVDGCIYAIGGTTKQGNRELPSAVVEEYNPVSDTWTERASMPTARATYACAANGKVYAISGTEDPVGWDIRTDPVAIVEAYDPKADSWSRVADIPTPRINMAVSEFDGKVYTIGGLECFVPLPQIAVSIPTVEEYTPQGWIVTSQAKLTTTWGAVKIQ